MAVEVTVGVDIGTTSVKALAVDADGWVVARARVPHELRAAHAGELAHDADRAWRAGVLDALDGLTAGADLDIRAIDVAAMVPSLCAVDGDGHPVSDGLLYGDDRGRHAVDPVTGTSEETLGFLEWLVAQHPDAAGFWPAQAVANRALGGVGAIDPIVAYLTAPLFDGRGWDVAVAAAAGVDDLGRLPVIGAGGRAVGEGARAGGAALGGGTIDAFGEQLVGGATEPGDVLVILGSTLIVWANVAEDRAVTGLWTVPSMAGGALIGGPSNAGGLFVGWVARLLGVDPRTGTAAPEDPARVPVWQPFVRGERVPFHDPARRASLHDLDIGLGPSAVLRAAHEATGFAVRHQLDLAGLAPERLVATGGGVRDPAWVRAIADATRVPVDVVAVPEGGALGAAWLARQVARLDPPGGDPSTWARFDHRVEPDGAWVGATAARYARYRELAG
jgi:xylulokinase